MSDRVGHDVDDAGVGHERYLGAELREAPIGELLKRLSTDMTTLMRQELELAKTELAEKAKPAAAGVGMFGGAGVAGLAALGALTACLILLLSLVVAAWAAALIVTVMYGAIALVLMQSGKKKFHEAAPLAPQQTIETVKEDVAWAKTQMKSAGR